MVILLVRTFPDDLLLAASGAFCKAQASEQSRTDVRDFFTNYSDGVSELRRFPQEVESM